MGRSGFLADAADHFCSIKRCCVAVATVLFFLCATGSTDVIAEIIYSKKS